MKTSVRCNHDNCGLRITNMRNDARDLTHSGLYMGCVAILLGSVALAGAAVVSQVPDSPLLSWALSDDASEPEENRLTRVVANAREIRAALAKPIPGVERLPPITAKLAYGHLKPGGKDYKTAQSMPKLPKAGLDAMAMDVSSSQRGFRASNAVAPELHKIY